jgi:DNA polymerase III subunit gamma/tau
MNYEVTAIKKRPRNFDELVGQEFIVATLKNALQTNRIANAYLFSGPRGVGKTSAARILAKALNCTTGITPSPCGACDACREITAGNALDVIEIDGASHTGVNDIREIRDEVLFTPSSYRYKIYIIDEVHMLSNSAFNALLKTIEEPPPYVVFIFATTEIHKVPATIRSRCQQYTFQLHGLTDIMKQLKTVAGDGGIKIDEESLVWIAKEATGSMRDAYTLFDQIASLADNEITIKKIRDKLGLVGVEEMTGLLGLLSEGNTKESIEAVNSILTKGIAEDQVLTGLADYFRNLLLLKNGVTRESILGMTKDGIRSEIVNAYSIPQTEKALEIILELLRNFRYSLNRHVELELLIVRLSKMRTYIPREEILARIENLKKELTAPGTGKADAGEIAAPSRESGAWDATETDTSAINTAPGAHAAGPLTGGQIIEKIREMIGRKKLALASALGKFRSAEYQNDELVIIFNEADKFAAESVGKEKQEIVQLAAQILNKPVTVKIVYAQRKDQAPDTKGDESEMIIKKVFKGSVVKGEEDGRESV